MRSRRKLPAEPSAVVYERSFISGRDCFPDAGCDVLITENLIRRENFLMSIEFTLRGRHAEAGRRFEAGRELLQGPQPIIMGLVAVQRLAALALACGRLETAQTLLEPAIRTATEAERPDLWGRAAGTLAEVLAQRGRIDEARAWLERAGEAGGTRPDASDALELLCVRTAVALAAGEPDEAAGWLDEADARVAAMGLGPDAPLAVKAAALRRQRDETH